VAMTIVVDPDKDRATDATSGMAVEFIREDYPLERGEFWDLLWKGQVYHFRVSWGDGFAKIEKEHPDLSIFEQSKLQTALNLKEYRISMINTADSHEFLENIDIFVSLFAAVARNRLKARNIHVYFEPWGIDKKYHRQLKFPPLADNVAQDKTEGNGR
jgi:hypothetical protein